MRINTKSIIFKTALVYLFMTVLNVSVFVLMVFENQMDLITENALLQSRQTGADLQARIDEILEKREQMSRSTARLIAEQASVLGIPALTLFSEQGRVFGAFTQAGGYRRDEATPYELKMINLAITKKDFERKMFAHRINTGERSIDLFIPFTYAEGLRGAAAVTLRMTSIDRHMTYLYRQCMIIALFIVVIHGLFAFTVSRMLVLPLGRLLRATQGISRGDLESRVPIVREDEIGRLAGAFNEMSVAIGRMRDEAKGANPLTGLPGNLTIARTIEERLAGGRETAVLYCDLDNFKAYNDKYGFSKGDEAILYTRDCLVEASEGLSAGAPSAESLDQRPEDRLFIGHQGGDDFVVVCDHSEWQPYAERIVSVFDVGVRRFYDRTDARNGYIDSINRQGEPQRFPLMSISVAVVSSRTRDFRSHEEMIEVAAEVKKVAKSMPGSSYAMDRRKASRGKGPGERHGPGEAEPSGKSAVSHRSYRNPESAET